MSHFPPLSDYYIVQDTTPGTGPWSTVAGAIVPWADATLAAWLPTVANNQAEFGTFLQILDCSSASAGAATSLHVNDTSQFTNGQKWNVSGTGGLYDGNQTITILDATHVTIPVAFAGNATGFLGGAAIIQTMAALLVRIDDYNVTLWTTGSFLGTNTLSGGADVTLTNPMLDVQNAAFISVSGATRKIILPKMNVPNSIPIGWPIIFLNNSNSVPTATVIQIFAQDGVTQIGQTLPFGLASVITLATNDTQNGSFTAGLRGLTNDSGAFWAVPRGGTGNQTLTNHGFLIGQGTAPVAVTAAPTDAQLPFGQTGANPALAPITGDVSVDKTGAATLLNIPNDTPMAGDVLATAIAAPSTPAAGKGRVYIDSTSKNIAVKDDAGIIKHGVQTITATASQFVTAINDAGAGTKAQPAFTDISGTATVAQGGTGGTKINSARMYLTTAQTGIAANTWTKVLYDTVDFDPDVIVDTVNHRIKPNVSGTFMAVASVYLNSTVIAQGGFAGCRLTKNGTYVQIGDLQPVSFIGNDQFISQTSNLIQMNGTTDYIEAEGLLQSSTTGTFNAGIQLTTLQLYRIGP